MKKEFKYRVLIVDDQTTSDFCPILQQTGIRLNAVVKNTIDEALLDMGVSSEDLLARRVGDDCRPIHRYDIVLLDFLMNENSAALVPRPDRGGAFDGVGYEYPMGALTLLPLYKLAFSPEMRGECIVQGYSAVIWEQCPKAAAVFEIVSNFNFPSGVVGLKDSKLEGLNMSELVWRRANSILSCAPVDLLEEFYSLLDCDEENDFWEANLTMTAIWLGCTHFTMRLFRPDLGDAGEAKRWLREQLMTRGYLHEAKRCWSNPIVNKVGHRVNLTHEEIVNASFQPSSWVTDNGLVYVGGHAYRVCEDVLTELAKFPDLISIGAAERMRKMHQIFRICFTNNDTTGTPLECLISCDDNSAKVMYDLCGSVRSFYLWMPGAVFSNLLAGFVELVRETSRGKSVFLLPAPGRRLLYVVAGQNDPIGEEDAMALFEVIRGATVNAPKGPFPILGFWGRLEIWGSELLWTTSGHFLDNLNRKQTVLEEVTRLGIINGCKGVLVMAIPLDVSGGKI